MTETLIGVLAAVILGASILLSAVCVYHVLTH